MRRLEDRVAEVLDRWDVVAAPLPEVVEEVARDGTGPRADEAALLATLRRARHRFRVLGACSGPWSACDVAGDAQAYRAPLRALGIHPGAWVVSLVPPGTSASEAPSRDPVASATAASLACLARTLDDRSPAATIRWLRLWAEDRRRCGSLGRRGGAGSGRIGNGGAAERGAWLTPSGRRGRPTNRPRDPPRRG